MDIISKIAEELKIKASQVEAAVNLIDEGNTIPFIARYRKEATGSLNDEILRDLDERLKYLRNLEDRKETVIASIEEQGKLTEELKLKIEEALTLVEVEDLYRPYKQKRRTRAMIAREKGLEGLAEFIMAQNATYPVEKEAEKYLSNEEGKEVEDVEAAINGAMDIIAEDVADVADYRTMIRKFFIDNGIVEAKVKDEEKDEKKVFENFYEYKEGVKNIPGHRILAINRGEEEKILTVKVDADQDSVIKMLCKEVITANNEFTTPVIEDAIKDSYQRLIYPSIEREIRSMLWEKAEDGAIDVFGKNLVQLLMQPPIAGETVLGWDPAFRTGCKLSIVDPTGKVLYTTVIYPTKPQEKIEESKKVLKDIIKKYGVTLISLGNGTASRESEKVICELLSEIDEDVKYVIVNEAGASVYSASKLATEEFPNFDVGQRSATSMARRLQDPLAELVKIDPKSVGVGQYQHDMDQKKLSESLTAVVEDCVNKVGVDLNTASAELLKYVAGINKTLATNIIEYREENGRFTSRKELLKVKKLGPKAFEQCAGFLRIRDGKEPLDATGVHPESYDAAKTLIKKAGLDEQNANKGGIVGLSLVFKDYKQLSEELNVGEITLKDIVKELEKPARDPRDEMPKPILKSDVLEMSDLKEGMILKGTVRNIIDFGAFVDIGVHQDGLVHISQLSDKFIKHPLDVVKIGDIVDVMVMSVDPLKNRIALTMKGIK